MTNNLIKIIIGGMFLIILSAGAVLVLNYFETDNTEIISTADTGPLTIIEIQNLYKDFMTGNDAYLKYVNDGANLNFAFEDKTTPLEKIIEAGDPESALAVINSGFDLTKVENNHIDTVSNIIAYNKDFADEDVNNIAVLLVAQIKDEIETEDSWGYSLLMNAITNNNEVLVNEILKYITDVDKLYTPLKDGVPQTEKSETALNYACYVGSKIEIVQALVNEGADVNFQGTEGYSCLMNAIFNNQNDVVEYLVSLPELNINLQNDLGQTALHISVEYSDIEAIDIILQNSNADKSIVDNDGRTAKAYAELLDMGSIFIDKL